MLRKFLTGVMLVCMCVLLSACPRIIETGEVGVSKSFGTINPEEIGVGVAWSFMLVRNISVKSIKLVEITQKSKVPTKGGMLIDMDATLFIKREPTLVAEQSMKIHGNPWETVVTPQFRAKIRNAVAAQSIESVYQEAGRELIAESATVELRKALEPHGFIVDSIVLRNIVLPEEFRDAVNAKLAAEQKVQQKGFELEQAMKDAEIEVARAHGAAESQKIVRSTLSNSYLQYLWIKTLNNNPNVIYVATEANMPLYRDTNTEMR